MKIIYFLQNHSINLPEIWSDCSIYICVWLFALLVLIIIIASNYGHSIKKESEETALSIVSSLSHELDQLELQNCYLKESYLAKQKEVDSLNDQLKRKRNTDGTFAIISGKGHGKKKLTV